MVDLVVTSVIPLSIFVGLPVLVWLLFMGLRWWRGYRKPREWRKRQSESSGRTSSDSAGVPSASPSALSVADLAAEGKRSTCAACRHDYWYEGGQLRKELSPRPWETLSHPLSQRLSQPESSRPRLHRHSPSAPALPASQPPPLPPSQPPSQRPLDGPPEAVFRL